MNINEDSILYKLASFYHDSNNNTVIFGELLKNGILGLLKIIFIYIITYTWLIFIFLSVLLDYTSIDVFFTHLVVLINIILLGFTLIICVPEGHLVFKKERKQFRELFFKRSNFKTILSKEINIIRK